MQKYPKKSKKSKAKKDNDGGIEGFVQETR